VNHLACYPVGLDARHAGPEFLDGPLLGLETDVVGAPELLRERAGRDRARAVGAVPVESRAPVDDDELVALDQALARIAVRLRPVRPRSDGGVEAQVVDAVRVQQLAQAPGELALAPADPRLRGQRLECAVGGARGATDPL